MFAIAGISALAAASAATAADVAPLEQGAGGPFAETLTPRLIALSSTGFRSQSSREQAEELSLPRGGGGSLLTEGTRYVVDVRAADVSSEFVGELRDAGAEILDVSREYATVTAAVHAGDLRALAAVGGVESVSEELAPFVFGEPGATTSAVSACGGAATSEGDAQLNASDARQDFGVSGAGVQVGILSDSFDVDATAPTHAAGDIASGDLPGPGNPCGRTTAVNVLQEEAGNDDEGRAMAQIIHDLAPDATMSFATAHGGQNVMANNIRALAAAGAEVVVDDVQYAAEPFFQDGPISNAVNDVTASGVSYFSAAGNSNRFVGGNNVGSWEAPSFRDAGACLVGAHCMDFDPGAGADTTFAINVAAGATLKVDLQWAEPWSGVATDMNAYLLDATNAVVAQSTANNVATTQMPFEFISFTNPTATTQTYRLEINRASGAASPRLKFVLLSPGGVTATEYPVSSGGDIVGPTIFGHNGAANAVSVAATPASNASVLEGFSGHGNVTHYFGPVSGTTPAAPLASPRVLAKPDLTATDGVSTTFFGSPSGSVFRFSGTSAAAPHAAAVAALELSGFPSASVGAVKSAEIATTTARSFDPTFEGSGLLNADAAVGSLLPHVTVSDASVTEAANGDRNLDFQVQVDKPNTIPMALHVGSAAQTATVDVDYAPVSATLTFAPGETSKTVSVLVHGDTAPESDETLDLHLSGAQNAAITDAIGTGTIVNQTDVSMNIRASARHRQKLGRLGVKVTADEAEDVTAGAVIALRPAAGGHRRSVRARRFTTRNASASLAAGQTATLRLKLPRRAARQVLKALRAGGHASATISITGTDQNGNTDSRRLGVTVTP